MTEADENAMFEVWFALERKRRWEKHNWDRGPEPSEAYLTGFKEHMREGWMARAGLHVIVQRPSVRESDAQEGR